MGCQSSGGPFSAFVASTPTRTSTPDATLTSTPVPATSTPESREADEAKIYPIVIENMVFNSYVDESKLLIAEETVPGTSAFDADHLPVTVGKDTLDDYDKPEKVKLSDLLGLKSRYRLLSQSEQDDFFPKGGFASWTRLQQRYPGVHGVLKLSRVGFNSEMSEGIAYAELDLEGGVGSTGYLYILARENGNWWIRTRVRIWVT